MQIIRIIQRLRTTPNNSKSGCYIRCSRSVGEFHVIAVDGVSKEGSIYTCDAALYIELAHKSALHYELANDMHFNPN